MIKITEKQIICDTCNTVFDIDKLQGYNLCSCHEVRIIKTKSGITWSNPTLEKSLQRNIRISGK